MYTHEDFKKLKKELGLNNKDLCEITGLAYQTVKNVSQVKELPTWARCMIWMHKQEPIQNLVKEANNTIASINKAVESIEIGCDCSFDGNGLFRRGKSGCKRSKEEHGFLNTK